DRPVEEGDVELRECERHATAGPARDRPDEVIRQLGGGGGGVGEGEGPARVRPVEDVRIQAHGCTSCSTLGRNASIAHAAGARSAAPPVPAGYHVPRRPPPLSRWTGL